MEVCLCKLVNDLRHSLFHLLSCLITTPSERRESHKEQDLNFREAEELSCNSLWQGWSCGLVHCHGGNATDPIWRVLASSDRIYSWTPLKPQHSHPNRLANQLWCSDFLTPPKPLIIPYRFPAFLEYLMPLKNWCLIHARWLESSLKHSIRFRGIFYKFKSLKCCHVRIAFLKFTSCDNQGLVGCIPIAAVAIHLNHKNWWVIWKHI